MKTLQRSFLNSLNMNIKTVLDVDVLSAAPIFSILIYEN